MLANVTHIAFSAKKLMMFVQHLPEVKKTFYCHDKSTLVKKESSKSVLHLYSPM